jgi:UDP-N-acetyl-D-galactosamine dehydrogenase
LHAGPQPAAGIDLDTATIAVVGLGYVGPPLAVGFGSIRPVIGFDIRPERIAELRQGRDSTLEVGSEAIVGALSP